MGRTSYRRSACRLCGSPALEAMFALAPTPPANALVADRDQALAQERFPLELCRCGECGHAQLGEVVDPEVLFRHYLYVSSTSPVMIAHLSGAADAIVERAGLRPGDFVLEFGSNDGTMLRFFQKHGMRVLGVDPARNIAEQATKSGVETLAEFFSPQVAQGIKAAHGAPRAICANNVCAHIDDLGAIFDAVKVLLAPDGLFVFEVGYLLDVMNNVFFDTIYHEHVDYHHVEPLIGFCQRHGLELAHVDMVDIQGGSIRCFVQHAGGPRAVDGSVAGAVEREHAQGLHRAETFLAFGRAIDQRRLELVSLLRGLKAQGRSIAAFGVPAKATTLLHYFGLSTDVIDYIVDENPLKQGLYSPGLGVPVVHQDRLEADRPDYLIILAWNFAQNIMARYWGYAEAGGRFIVPLPNLALAGKATCA